MVSVEIIMSFWQPRKVLKKKNTSELPHYLNGTTASSCNLKVLRERVEDTVHKGLF